MHGLGAAAGQATATPKAGKVMADGQKGLI
jgi:hypothetical protein